MSICGIIGLSPASLHRLWLMFFDPPSHSQKSTSNPMLSNKPMYSQTETVHPCAPLRKIESDALSSVPYKCPCQLDHNIYIYIYMHWFAKSRNRLKNVRLPRNTDLPRFLPSHEPHKRQAASLVQGMRGTAARC